MKPCISQATTMATPFAEDIAAYSAAGFRGVDVWLTKLENHLSHSPVSDTKKLLEEKQIALVAASYQGGLLLSQGEPRRAHFDHFKQRLDLCQQFGIRTMLLVADFAQKVDATALERAVVSFKQAAQWADGFGVTLALEFRGSDAFCASLDTALGLVLQCDEPNTGVCFDVFHYYKGPSKFDDLDLLTKENLAFVQVCDIAGLPREIMADSDRVFPGDGEFRLDAIVTKLRDVGYDGWISLELFNPLLWQMKPAQVAELGMSAMDRLLKPRAG